MKQGWEKSTLGESCDFFNGKAHEKAIHEDGNYTVVNSKFISRDGKIKKYTREQMFPLFKNDIVMVMSDVPNGKALAKCYLIEKDNIYSLNQRICAIRSENFIHKYLFYQLNRHKYLLSFNNGENQTNLRKNDILKTPLYIPSFDEQKRIVSKLDECFEAIDKARVNVEKNLNNAKELFQSQLNEIFSQKGDGWVEKTIIDLCSHKSQIIGGPFGSNLKVKDYRDSGIPILRLQNIGKGYFIDKSIKYISEQKAEELAYHSFKAGDIILAKLGIPIGKTCIVPKKFERGIVVADVVRIRPNKEEINYIFLKYFLNSDNSVTQLSSEIRGSTRPRVNIGEVRGLKLSVPDISEQVSIVEKIDDLESQTQILESNYQQELDALDELKKSILEKAFNGEL